MNYKKIGLYIQEKRKDKNLTQKDLAKKLFLTDKAISKWERGLGCPDVSTLEELSNVLDVSILSILNGEDAEELEVRSAIIKTINYSKLREKNNFKTIITNFLFVIIFSIIAFLIHSNIAHIIYLNNVNEITVAYDSIKDSILMVEKIKENIDKISDSNLIYSNEDKEYILNSVNESYDNIINHDFYNQKEDRVYTLKEIYEISNKLKTLSNIAVIRKIEEYDDEGIVNIKAYIDFTLLKMLNKQNIFGTITTLDVYNSPFDFKAFDREHVSTLVLYLDFRAEVQSLYDLTQYVLIVGDINE